mmetsp:Transcript_6821/g.10992  ORF Transcript_6821/g.10992 Transcript_6821/m.10992 type:complete len:608 (+) Transcript_6821:2642-4465(+)
MGEPVVNNQNDIAAILLEDENSCSQLMMPVRMRQDGKVDVLIDSQDASYLELNKYKSMKRNVYGYFLSLIDLAAELCLSRNMKSANKLQEMYSFDTVQSIVKDEDLPYEMRALFMRVMLHMHMDREPLEPIHIPSQTGVWKDLPKFFEENFQDKSNMVYNIITSKITVPPSLTAIKKFVEVYLESTGGVQNIFEMGRNMMTLEILRIIKFMLNHGFYNNLHELKQVAKPMVNLLDGSNDIYYDVNDENMSGAIEDFVSVKRYFSSGSNDIIVQSKAIICENLLIISQLEIDGKVEIFLSKFKKDLEMSYMKKQMKAAQHHGVKEEGPPVSNMEMLSNKFNKVFSCFKNMTQTADEDMESISYEREIEQSNLMFFEDIALSTNFESENRDAYICVLFDLLLYKYPELSRGVFELLVRLFTRKRTLLESLQRIQMLEDPASVKVLSKVKKYSLDLRKYKEDADQWLNKSNKQSDKIKYEVTRIFKYFTDSCVDTSTNIQEEEDEDTIMDLEKKQPPKIETPDLEPATLPAEEPDGEFTAKSHQSTTVMIGGSKVSQSDFVLFEEKTKTMKKENQRLLSSFGIEKMAMYFIKYRVDRNSINDPMYQQLIH